jgi:hypothetical protein
MRYIIMLSLLLFTSSIQAQYNLPYKKKDTHNVKCIKFKKVYKVPAYIKRRNKKKLF